MLALKLGLTDYSYSYSYSYSYYHYSYYHYHYHSYLYHRYHNSYSVNEAGSPLCYCQPGYSGPDNGNCGSAPRGMYKQVNGSMAFVQCPDNMDTHQKASDALTDCECSPGYVGPNGGPCAKCAAGQYKQELGPMLCEVCPASWRLKYVLVLFALNCWPYSTVRLTQLFALLNCSPYPTNAGGVSLSQVGH